MAMETAHQRRRSSHLAPPPTQSLIYLIHSGSFGASAARFFSRISNFTVRPNLDGVLPSAEGKGSTGLPSISAQPQIIVSIRPALSGGVSVKLRPCQSQTRAALSDAQRTGLASSTASVEAARA